MKYLFLVIAVGCLALFVVAGLLSGDQVASPAGEAQNAFRARRDSGPSLWSIVQNVSAVAGIASFLIQMVQWRRYRRLG